jgi:hypothetical protein
MVRPAEPCVVRSASEAFLTALLQPQESAHELHERQVIARGFLIPGCDGSEAFHSMNEQFDVVPEPVESAIQPSLAFSCRIAVNHCCQESSCNSKRGVRQALKPFSPELAWLGDRPADMSLRSAVRSSKRKIK